MKQVPLNAKVRTVRGSADCRRLRAKGFIPAEVYGHKEANLTIEVNAKELSQILFTNRGENIFFMLNIEGAKGEPQMVILKEVQNHKLKSTVIHADFLKVNMKEKIRIKVPVKLLNADICDGVKAGGVLQLFLRAVEVSCLPNQIPDAINVDTATFAIGHSVHVSDLPLPEGVKAVTPGDSVVLSVAQQMAEEVKAAAVPGAEGAAAAPTAAEPEVLTAKKKEEGEAGKVEAGKGDAKAAEKKPAEKK